MTEEDAKGHIAAHVSRETLAKLEAYAALLVAGATIQNLISASTLPTLWQRHILDSAQLAWLDDGAGPWVDIGSGAGLPGMVVAIVTDRPVVLCEPRALRVGFLQRCVAQLSLDPRVSIVPRRIQLVKAQAEVISARAVAGVDAIFAMAGHLATPRTRWILPRGRSAADEVAAALRLWQGRFQLVPSITDSESATLIATEVRRRKSR